MIEFIRLYTQLVESCHGSLTGNGPEGRVKALMLAKKLSISEEELYMSIKEAFDPRNILNPKVKLGVDIKDTVRHLRTTALGGIIGV